MKRIFLLLALLVASASASARPDLPVIPDMTVSITDFGGVGDGTVLNTEAFRKAIDGLAAQGGGHLNVPEGIWLTGPIVLKDAVDLHLERGAILLFSPDKTLYLSGKSVRPAITASKRHDVSISGEGIIDGNGEWWRPVKRGKVSDTEWNDYKKMGGSVTADGKLWYPFNLRHAPNLADTQEAQEKMRTHLIRLTDCERVAVTGVTIQNSPKFHLVPQRCRQVTFADLTVRCPWNAQNGDGIDIMQSSDVLVTRCTVDVGDDGICLKAGAGAKALEAGPVRNVVIEYNTVYHAHGGFVIGSEFSGGIENVTVRHNVFAGTDTGLRFKSAPERGGTVKNLRISDIVMTDIRGEAVVFETSYADRPAGHDDREAAKTENFLPDFTDIVIERVTCHGADTAVRASGTLRTIHDILIRDAVFFYTDKDKALDDPAMIRFENVRFETYE